MRRLVRSPIPSHRCYLESTFQQPARFQPRLTQALLYRNFIQPIVDHAGLDVGQIAFLNLLNWRTVPKARMRKLYHISWKAHSRAQIELLQPSVIICLGAGVGRALQRLYCGGARCFALRRVIGDRIGRDGREDI